MVQCCVPFCKSTPGPSNNYSFHEFPVTKIRVEWLRRIARKANGTSNKPWCPSDRSKVCSLHFREEDFRRDLKIRRLLPNAVPSIFPGYPPEMQLARRLSPQKGDALKLLETSSATEESVARPQRGRKRKRTQRMPERQQLPTRCGIACRRDGSVGRERHLAALAQD
ncbi:THAP domain-containing protein 1 isoform X2 [Rhipicephalus microplus]|uniref:THAP domain-containing protein 1 isoform X2 n=1 Tax=Rhipicephalus microplus TaxID=6941 RepID=UPI003F6C29CF